MWSPRVEKSRDWLTEGVAFTIRRETIYMQREKSKTLHIKYTKIREHQTVMNRKTFNLLCDVDGEEKMCFCESVNVYWLGLLVYMEMYVVIIMQLIQSVGPTRRKQDPSNNDDGMRWFRSKTFRQKIQIISTSHMVAVRWRWSSKKKTHQTQPYVQLLAVWPAVYFIFFECYRGMSQQQPHHHRITSSQHQPWRGI